LDFVTEDAASLFLSLKEAFHKPFNERTKGNRIKSQWNEVSLFKLRTNPRDTPDVWISHDDLRCNDNIYDMVSWDCDAGC
jgi:hypothetical protein